MSFCVAFDDMPSFSNVLSKTSTPVVTAFSVRSISAVGVSDLRRCWCKRVAARYEAKRVMGEGIEGKLDQLMHLLLSASTYLVVSVVPSCTDAIVPNDE